MGLPLDPLICLPDTKVARDYAAGRAHSGSLGQRRRAKIWNGGSQKPVWKSHPVLIAHIEKKLDSSFQNTDSKPKHDIANEDL